MTNIDLARNTEQLVEAAGGGHLAELQRLISITLVGISRPEDSLALYSLALRKAAEAGHVACVDALIPHCGNRTRNSNALAVAAMNGHVECVKLLIPVSDPKNDDSIALCIATQYEHREIVKMLIPVSDPKAKNNAALWWAVANKDEQCMDLLYDVSDVPSVVQRLQKHFKDPDLWRYLEQRMVAEQQHKELHAHVLVDAKPTDHRKI